jgi:hypothetical protein
MPSVICAILFLGLFVSPMALPGGGQGSQVGSGPAAAQSPTANARPILVELFTSEGCSSCPPADALLETMDTAQPVEGAQLIVLSEHVDYWDHDGWKDPNSSPAFTERQAEYVRTLRLPTPYTPQILVDGTTEVHANDDPKHLDQIFHQAAAASKIPVSIGEVVADAGNPSVLHARIEADGTSDNRNADVFVAVALDHVESQVARGENSGRHLTHVAVVTQITKVGKLPKGKTFTETVSLKLKPGIDPGKIRIVAFVQEPGPGKLLGAALRKPTS